MRRRGHGRRAQMLFGAWLVLVMPTWAASGQAPPSGSLPNFTGTVKNVPAPDLRAVRFTYEAGARSYWHTHEGPLILLIEQGRGRMQVQGEKVREILVGQPVVFPAGVPHWHGAAPDQGLTWVALSVGETKMMGPVGDDEYLGRK